MTSLEAMPLKMPIVASRVGGYIKIIEDQKTGVLIEYDVTDVLVPAVECLVNDSHWSEALDEQAQQVFHAHFSFKHMVVRIASNCMPRNLKNCVSEWIR